MIRTRRAPRRHSVAGALAGLACSFALPHASVAWAQGAPAATPAAVASSGKPCDNARKKVAREQRTSAEVADALAKSQRARATCTSRTTCARADEAIRDTERQQSRQATRLARFEQEVKVECGR